MFRVGITVSSSVAACVLRFSHLEDRLVWTYSGIRLDSCATNGFLIACWQGQMLLLSFTSLAKVFVQRCSREPCDLLYTNREGGYVVGAWECMMTFLHHQWLSPVTR